MITTEIERLREAWLQEALKHRAEINRLRERVAELEAARNAAGLILDSFELVAKSHMDKMSVETIRDYIGKVRSVLAGDGGAA